MARSSCRAAKAASSSTSSTRPIRGGPCGFNWLDINGAGAGANGVRIVSGNLAGTSIVVENTTIDGLTARGISDERGNGGKLVVTDTTIRHTVGAGIHIGPGAARIDATLTNVKVHNSATAGVAVDGNGKVMISNSVLSGSTAGIDIAPTNIEVLADNVTLSGNTTGMEIGAGATLRLSNSNVAFNGTGLNGTIQSHSTNRLIGNGAGGTFTRSAPERDRPPVARSSQRTPI